MEQEELEKKLDFTISHATDNFYIQKKKESTLSRFMDSTSETLAFIFNMETLQTILKSVAVFAFICSVVFLVIRIAHVQEQLQQHVQEQLQQDEQQSTIQMKNKDHPDWISFSPDADTDPVHAKEYSHEDDVLEFLVSDIWKDMPYDSSPSYTDNNYDISTKNNVISISCNADNMLCKKGQVVATIPFQMDKHRLHFKPQYHYETRTFSNIDDDIDIAELRAIRKQNNQ